MQEGDQYILGRNTEEEARLERQIVDLATDSAAHLDRVGIVPGERVPDMGCGPGGVLHLLAERVGAAGSVLGIERSAHFVEVARRFLGRHGIANVEVREGDGYDTGLPRASFDGAHMRLVLVNVPQPERIVREVVSLVRPGGWVASFEADYVAHLCDPPLPEWSQLLAAFTAYAESQGIDLFVGRRAHRLFREAGLEDISVDAVVHVYPPGHDRRTILRDFVGNTRNQLIDGGFIAAEDYERAVVALEGHLADPSTQVTSHLFYRLHGRVPR
jgi:ubiquinone/menaquinone biosynthesis C-methylase UbiE